MMSIFTKWFIGGATGSREGAWFLVLTLVIAPFYLMVWSEYCGQPMETLQDSLMIFGPAVLTLWSVAHGLQKAIDNNLFKKND